MGSPTRNGLNKNAQVQYLLDGNILRVHSAGIWPNRKSAFIGIPVSDATTSGYHEMLRISLVFVPIVKARTGTGHEKERRINRTVLAYVK